METFVYYPLMGMTGRLKSGVEPHEFDCLEEVTSQNENMRRLQSKSDINLENIIEPDQNPSCQPDPKDQRKESDEPNDPDSLTPSSEDIGSQAQHSTMEIAGEVTSGPVYKCIPCRENFTEKIDHILHKANHASNITFLQKIRRKYLSHFRYRLRWKSFHIDNFQSKSYFCMSCQKSFIKKSTIENHMERCNSNNSFEFKCLFCGYICDSYPGLVTHSQEHANEQPYHCGACEQSFVSLTALTRHEQLHKTKRFLCFICGRGFLKRFYFERHIASHPEENSCMYCEKLFASKVDLAHHHWSNEQAGPIPPCRLCQVHIQVKCLYVKHAKEHLDIEEGVKKEIVERLMTLASYTGNDSTYSCLLCSKIYQSLDAVLKHLESHFGLCLDLDKNSDRVSYEHTLNNKSWHRALLLTSIDENIHRLFSRVDVSMSLGIGMENHKLPSVEKTIEILRSKDKGSESSDSLVEIFTHSIFGSVSESSAVQDLLEDIDLCHSPTEENYLLNRMSEGKDKNTVKKVTLACGGSFKKLSRMSEGKVKNTVKKVTLTCGGSFKNLSICGKSPKKESQVSSESDIYPLVESLTSESHTEILTPFTSQNCFTCEESSESNLYLGSLEPYNSSDDSYLKDGTNEEPMLDIEKQPVYEALSMAHQKTEIDHSKQENAVHSLTAPEIVSVSDSTLKDSTEYSAIVSVSDRTEYSAYEGVGNCESKKERLEPSVSGIDKTMTLNNVNISVEKKSQLLDSTSCKILPENSLESDVLKKISASDLKFHGSSAIQGLKKKAVSHRKRGSGKFFKKYKKCTDCGRSFRGKKSNHVIKCHDVDIGIRKMDTSGQLLDSTSCKAVPEYSLAGDIKKEFSTSDKKIIESSTIQGLKKKAVSHRKRGSGKFFKRYKKCTDCGRSFRGKKSNHVLKYHDVDIGIKKMDTSGQLLDTNSLSTLLSSQGESTGEAGSSLQSKPQGLNLKGVNTSNERSVGIIKTVEMPDNSQGIKRKLGKESRYQFKQVDRPYCPLCGLFFRYTSTFEAHRRLHEKASWFVCYLCEKIYRSKDKLSLHCKVHHSEDEFSLYSKLENEIPPRHKENQDRVPHRQNKNPNRIPARQKENPNDVTHPNGKTTQKMPCIEFYYGCSFCGKKFKAKSDFHNHIKNLNTEGEFGCLHCKRLFDKSVSFKIHANRTHLKKPAMSCSLCKIVFDSKSAYDSHLQKHRKVGWKTCFHCGKNFSSQSIHFVHVERVHFLEPQDKSHERITVSEEKTSEETHKRKLLPVVKQDSSVFQVDGQIGKTLEKTYKCPACRRSFYNRDTFAAHIVIHEKSKWYICCDCTLCFWFKEGLVEHRRDCHQEIVTMEEKEFEAQKEAQITADKTEEMGNVSQVERANFQCSVCSKEMFYRKTFKDHVLIHEKDGWFICFECGNTYRDVNSLSHHQKEYHSKESISSDKISYWKKHFEIRSDLKVKIERMPLCKICGEYYGGSPEEYSQHKVLHEEKEVKLCEQTFEDKGLLVSCKEEHKGIGENSIWRKSSKRVKYYKQGRMRWVNHPTGVDHIKRSDILFQSEMPRNKGTVNLLKENLMVKRWVKKLKCNMCDVKFFHKLSLSNHIKNCHADENLAHVKTIDESISSEIVQNVSVESSASVKDAVFGNTNDKAGMTTGSEYTETNLGELHPIASHEKHLQFSADIGSESLLVEGNAEHFNSEADEKSHLLKSNVSFKVKSMNEVGANDSDAILSSVVTQEMLAEKNSQSFVVSEFESECKVKSLCVQNTGKGSECKVESLLVQKTEKGSEGKVESLLVQNTEKGSEGKVESLFVENTEKIAECKDENLFLQSIERDNQSALAIGYKEKQKENIHNYNVLDLVMDIKEDPLFVGFEKETEGNIHNDSVLDSVMDIKEDPLFVEEENYSLVDNIDGELLRTSSGRVSELRFPVRSHSKDNHRGTFGSVSSRIGNSEKLEWGNNVKSEACTSKEECNGEYANFGNTTKVLNSCKAGEQSKSNPIVVTDSGGELLKPVKVRGGTVVTDVESGLTCSEEFLKPVKEVIKINTFVADKGKAAGDGSFQYMEERPKFPVIVASIKPPPATNADKVIHMKKFQVTKQDLKKFRERKTISPTGLIPNKITIFTKRVKLPEKSGTLAPPSVVAEESVSVERLLHGKRNVMHYFEEKDQKTSFETPEVRYPGLPEFEGVPSSSAKRRKLEHVLPENFGNTSFPESICSPVRSLYCENSSMNSNRCLGSYVNVDHAPASQLKISPLTYTSSEFPASYKVGKTSVVGKSYLSTTEEVSQEMKEGSSMCSKNTKLHPYEQNIKINFYSGKVNKDISESDKTLSITHGKHTVVKVHCQNKK